MTMLVTLSSVCNVSTKWVINRWNCVLWVPAYTLVVTKGIVALLYIFVYTIKVKVLYFHVMSVVTVPVCPIFCIRWAESLSALAGSCAYVKWPRHPLDAGWVSPRSGLVILEKEKSLAPAENRTTIVRLYSAVTMPTELSRLPSLKCMCTGGSFY
jgi:hypothetical protein